MENETTVPYARRLYIAAFSILAVLVFIAGFFYYQNRTTSVKRDKFNELSAIAQLKQNQIQTWRENTIVNGVIFSKNEMFISELNQYLKGKQSPGNILLRLDLEKKLRGFSSVGIIDTDFKCILCDSLLEFDKNLIPRDLFKFKKPFLSNIYPNEDTTSFRIDLYVPLIRRNENVAVLILQQNPEDFIYPLLQTYPTPSKTSETLIFYLEEDYLVYLNRLRHSNIKPFKLKLPINDPDLPAAMLARGETGIVEGNDYRGVPVLADLRKIPDTEWLLVTKVDKDELLSTLNQEITIVVLFTLILIACIGLGISFLWKIQRAKFYRELYDAESQKKEILQRSLSEKEFLMKEIHHRVKNNLQIIASLLNLQSNALNDEKTRNIFRDTSNRIQSIAMVHHKLYSDNLGTVNTKNYIPELVGLISDSYCTNEREIEIKMNIAPLEFKIDNAVYLGLLINEVLTNSYKHAFNGRNNGEIKIDLTSSTNADELIIEDNGSGFNPAKSKTGLGSVLLETLIEQLDGTMELKSENGTSYKFLFNRQNL